MANFLLGWKNYFKAITRKISYTEKAAEKGYDYLIDCTLIAKKICKRNDMDFDRLPISDDEKIAGFHYFQFKKYFDGEPKDFEEVFIMDVIGKYHYQGFRGGKHQFDPNHGPIFDKFLKFCVERPKKFTEGVKYAQKKIKDKDELDKFEDLYKEFIK